MMGTIVSIALAATVGTAMAQYTGVPRQRDVYGQPCPPTSVYRGGVCVDAAGRAPSDQESSDWRKLRQRELEERERTAGERQREDDWRIQRQRELDDRYGQIPIPSQPERQPSPRPVTD